MNVYLVRVVFWLAVCSFVFFIQNFLARPFVNFQISGLSGNQPDV
jgi:hypothetical protein